MSNRSVLLATLFLSFTSAADPGDVRVRRDEPRARTWVLRADALYLRETGARERRFVLPGWVYAAPPQASEPDLLVEPGGSVIVSSNVVPSLWRVDPQASRIEEMKLALDPATDRDVGFTALRAAEHGTITANATTDRSRWKIDLSSRRATKTDGRIATY